MRLSVGANTSTPTDTLTQLALDEDADVRGAVARNKITFTRIIDGLLEDGDREVRNVAVGHPSASAEALEQWYRTNIAEESIETETLISALNNGLRIQDAEMCALLAIHGTPLGEWVGQNLEIIRQSTLETALKNMGAHISNPKCVTKRAKLQRARKLQTR